MALDARTSGKVGALVVETVPVGCLCHWVNHGEMPGWRMVDVHPDCPFHERADAGWYWGRRGA